MEQEKQQQQTYTEEMMEALKAQPEDKREMLAAHMLGIVEGVKLASAMEKKSA